MRLRDRQVRRAPGEHTKVRGSLAVVEQGAWNGSHARWSRADGRVRGEPAGAGKAAILAVFL